MSFFAAAHNFEVIMISYERLFRVITSHKEVSVIDDIDNESRLEIFSCAWEIIEHADSLRQIVEGTNPFNAPASYPPLLAFLKQAHWLRNKKVHLSNQIGNIITKKLDFPLHGIVKWTITSSLREPFKHGVNMNVLTVEPLTHPGVVKFDSTEGLTDVIDGVDNITVQAFGKYINVTRFISALRDYSAEFEGTIERIVEKVTEKGAAKPVSSLPEALQGAFFLKVLAKRE